MNFSFHEFLARNHQSAFKMKICVKEEVIYLKKEKR